MPLQTKSRPSLFCVILATAALCPLSFAAAQTTPPVSSPAVPRTALPAAYRIAPGDTLDISIFGKPDLARTIAIPPDGRISYPFVGQMVVAGRTVEEVTRQLKQGLARELRTPLVTVNVTRRSAGEVSILGPVRSPGKRALGDNWRVLQLIADSGGLSVKPDWATAKLVRGQGATVVAIDLRQLMAGDAEQNLLLAPDDTLLIDEVDASRVAVQVLGEVGKPGSVVVPKDGSLLSIITSVGGFTPRASLSRVSLMRGGKTYTLDMRELMSSGKVTQAQDPLAISGATTATGGVALGSIPVPGAPTTPAGIAASDVPITPAAPQEISPAPAVSTPELDLAVIKAEPGDTLLVPQNRLLFSVMGAVNRPGVSEFPENQPVTVLSAITFAGGIGGGADLKNAAVVRPNVVTGKPDIQNINIEDLLKNKQSKNEVRDVALQPGDVLYIPEKGPGRRRMGLQDVLSVVPLLGWFVR
ncbi:MAG: SLBB domain-containing protein [Armatimonadota bacterium]